MSEPRITSIDSHGGSISSPHRMHYDAPVRVWERTESGGWTSREWVPGRWVNPGTPEAVREPGEKATYQREVLGW